MIGRDDRIRQLETMYKRSCAIVRDGERTFSVSVSEDYIFPAFSNKYNSVTDTGDATDSTMSDLLAVQLECRTYQDSKYKRMSRANVLGYVRREVAREFIAFCTSELSKEIKQ